MDKNSARGASPRNPFAIKSPEASEAISYSVTRTGADLAGGIGRIGLVARIVVGGTIAPAVVAAAAGTTMEFVLTIVVGAMAGATTD